MLVKQLQPRAYAVQLFDGARVVSPNVVDSHAEAFDVAAVLWGVFIDRPLIVGYLQTLTTGVGVVSGFTDPSRL